MSLGQNTAAAEKLTSYLERIENVLEEIDGLKGDLKDLKLEARNDGFNVTALLRLVAIRRDKQRASQENELLNDLVLYAHATGMPLDIAGLDDDARSPPAARPADAGNGDWRVRIHPHPTLPTLPAAFPSLTASTPSVMRGHVQACPAHPRASAGHGWGRQAGDGRDEAGRARP